MPHEVMVFFWGGVRPLMDATGQSTNRQMHGSGRTLADTTRLSTTTMTTVQTMSTTVVVHPGAQQRFDGRPSTECEATLEDTPRLFSLYKANSIAQMDPIQCQLH